MLADKAKFGEYEDELPNKFDQVASAGAQSYGKISTSAAQMLSSYSSSKSRHYIRSQGVYTLV